jgi:hypothetical protein
VSSRVRGRRGRERAVAYWSSTIDLGWVPQILVGGFTLEAPNDPAAALVFQVGGELGTTPTPYKVCFDELRLEEPPGSVSENTHAFR